MLKSYEEKFRKSWVTFIEIRSQVHSIPLFSATSVRFAKSLQTDCTEANRLLNCSCWHVESGRTPFSTKRSRKIEESSVLLAIIQFAHGAGGGVADHVQSGLYVRIRIRTYNISSQCSLSRHITGKFEIAPLTFFATYDYRGGFAVQFGLCSVKIR